MSDIIAKNARRKSERDYMAELQTRKFIREPSIRLLVEILIANHWQVVLQDDLEFHCVRRATILYEELKKVT